MVGGILGVLGFSWKAIFVVLGDLYCMVLRLLVLVL